MFPSVAVFNPTCVSELGLTLTSVKHNPSNIPLLVHLKISGLKLWICYVSNKFLSLSRPQKIA
jgi:hypothetical protein